MEAIKQLLRGSLLTMFCKGTVNRCLRITIKFCACINSMEEKTGPDRPVGPVQPGTGPQAGLVSTTKPVVVKTGQKSGKPVKTGKNRSTGFVFFFFF